MNIFNLAFNLIPILFYGNALAKQSFPGSLVDSYSSYEASDASQEKAQDTGFFTDLYEYGTNIIDGLPYQYGLDLYDRYCKYN